MRLLPATGAVLALALSGCGTAADSDGAAAPAPAPEGAPVTDGAEGAPGNTAPDDAAPGDGGADGSSTTEGPGAGTGTATPSSPGTTTSGPTSSDEQGVGRCHTSMLSGELRPSGAGAGQRYAELTLTNTSGETCNLYGYGGLELVGEHGQALPTRVERTGDPEPRLITLAPDESASSTLHWTVVPTGDEPVHGPCAPDPTHANVIPPDETDSLVVSWPAGPVCGHGEIDAGAYR
ncbi:hypothetical protein GCM10027174_04470 [Salinifilum aidingensis]